MQLAAEYAFKTRHVHHDNGILRGSELVFASRYVVCAPLNNASRGSTVLSRPQPPSPTLNVAKRVNTIFVSRVQPQYKRCGYYMGVILFLAANDWCRKAHDDARPDDVVSIDSLSQRLATNVPPKFCSLHAIGKTDAYGSSPEVRYNGKHQRPPPPSHPP